jgi:ubiquinone/menaquinone biosynthesis C-methylase UbiE
MAKEFELFAQTTAALSWDHMLRSAPPHADRALDAGCGTGILALRMAQRIRRVVGLDMSPSMIALANEHRVENRGDNLSLVMGDLERLPFGDQSFDFVVSHAALHTTCLHVTLPGLRRLLRPGGRMVIFNLVSWHPRLDAYPPIQLLCALMSAPQYLRLYGIRTMLRLVSFRASGAWMRYVLESCPRPTPRAFMELCRRHLPGCRLERTHRWAMTVTWNAP